MQAFKHVVEPGHYPVIAGGLEELKLFHISWFNIILRWLWEFFLKMASSLRMPFPKSLNSLSGLGLPPQNLHKAKKVFFVDLAIA